MTSKISFIKLMGEDMKRKIGLVALSILIFFVSFPVVMLVILENQKYRGFYITREVFQSIVLTMLGIENLWICVITGMGALLCGLFGFSYLFNKKKVDFYHSIPVKREKLFLASYLNGLLIYIVPYVFSLLICIVIGSGYAGLSAAIIRAAASQFGVQLLYFLLLYHVTIAVTLLAGNMITALYLNGTVQLYGIGVYLIYIAYQNIFYDTFYNENAVESINQMGRLSPVMSLVNAYMKLNHAEGIYILQLQEGRASSTLYLMRTAVWMAAFFVLAWIIYKKRPSEAAGRALAFPVMKSFLRILIVIPVAMAGGLLFWEMLYSNAYVWMLFGIVFIGFLCHAVLEILFESDVRAMFACKLQLVCTVVVAVLLTLIFKNDLTGYDTRLMAEKDLQYGAISIRGIHDRAEYWGWDTEKSERFYIASGEYSLEKMQLQGEALQAVYELAQAGIELNRNGNEEQQYASVTIQLTGKNGKEQTRRYNIPLEECFDRLALVYRDSTYKEILKEMLLQGKDATRSHYDVRGNGGYEKELSDAEGEKLFELYAEDLDSLSLQELRDTPNVGEICYRYSYESGEYAGNYENELYLYPGMEKTFAYLEQIGVTDTVDFEYRFNPEEVAGVNVELNGYDGDAYDMDWTETAAERKGFDIEDKEEIAELCEGLYLVYYVYENQLFWDDVRSPWDMNICVVMNDVYNESHVKDSMRYYAQWKTTEPLSEILVRVRDEKINRTAE